MIKLGLLLILLFGIMDFVNAQAEDEKTEANNKHNEVSISFGMEILMAQKLNIKSNNNIFADKYYSSFGFLRYGTTRPNLSIALLTKKQEHSLHIQYINKQNIISGDVAAEDIMSFNLNYCFAKNVYTDKSQTAKVYTGIKLSSYFVKYNYGYRSDGSAGYVTDISRDLKVNGFLNKWTTYLKLVPKEVPLLVVNLGLDINFIGWSSGNYYYEVTYLDYLNSGIKYPDELIVKKINSIDWVYGFIRNGIWTDNFFIDIGFKF